MRVVAGTARSIPLKSRDGLDTRPTADRVKEAIFNILQFDASHAVIVDRSPEALAVIRENLERTKLADRAEVIRADYQEYLRRCGRRFSIILLDPPYRRNFLENALKQISEIDILKTGGIIVCEKPVEKGLDPAYGGIRHAKDYRYGKTMISVYRAAAPFDGQ